MVGWSTSFLAKEQIKFELTYDAGNDIGHTIKMFHIFSSECIAVAVNTKIKKESKNIFSFLFTTMIA